MTSHTGIEHEQAPFIGHNQPPAHEEHAAAMRALEIEAEPYLTGAAITDDGQAKAIAELAERIMAALKAAANAEETEKRPHLDATKAIRESYAPAIKTGERLRKAAVGLLGAWRRECEARRAKEAADLAAEAERQRIAAAKALKDSAGDYAARQEAEDLNEAARTTAIAARAVAKLPVGAKVGGKTVRMRRVYAAAITRENDALAWAWDAHFERVWKAVALEIYAIAETQVRAANGAVGQHEVAGGAIIVTVSEEAI